MPRKRRWKLSQIVLEFNVIVAKVKMLFTKEEVPKRASRRKKTQAKQIVQNELKRINSDTTEKPNVIADTIAQIARKERNKAIRQGYYEDAIVSSIIEYVAQNFKKRPVVHAQSEANTL